MIVVVNDQPRELPANASVSDLLKDLGLDRQACAVEVNRQLVPKPRHTERVLAEGDKIEVVTLVGGG